MPGSRIQKRLRGCGRSDRTRWPLSRPLIHALLFSLAIAVGSPPIPAALPFTPFADVLGFTALPAVFFAVHRRAARWSHAAAVPG